MFLDCFLFMKISGNYTTLLCNIPNIYLNSKKDIISLV